MNNHRLKIRCPTWDHLENFYERKVKPGNLLLARVPFSPAIGDSLVIALELPDRIVIELEAEVLGAKQAPDGRRSAIRMHLFGLDEKARIRLSEAVSRGRRGTDRILPLREPAPVSMPRTQTGIPVPLPTDVPMDEEVIRVQLPDVEEVPEKVREQYRQLEKTLLELREKSAHDVLGVRWDADVSEVRKAYFSLVKQFHPDVLARHDSDDILLLSSEIFLYVNQAYDRLRDSAVTAGKALAAGPALLPHSGWSANFDEIGSVRSRQPLRSDDLSAPTAIPRSLSPLAVQAPSTRDSIVIQFDGGPRKSVRPKEASKQIAKGKAADPKRDGGSSLKGSSLKGSSSESSSLESSSSEGSSLEGSDLFTDARETQAGMVPLKAPKIEEPEPAEVEKIDIAVLRQEGEEAMKAEDYSEARRCFAKVLEVAPRERAVRALYHVAFAHTLKADSKDVEALTQLEVALQHDSDCHEAEEAKTKFEKKGGKKSRLRKWFRS